MGEITINILNSRDKDCHPGIGIVLGPMLMAMGGVICKLLVGVMALASVSLHWCAVPGRVTEFSKEIGRHSYYFTVKYAYTYNGKSYEGSRYNFGLVAVSYVPFRVGEEVDVFVDPARPSLCVLRPGLVSSITKVFCAAGIMIMISGLFLTIDCTVRVLRKAKSGHQTQKVL